MSLLLSSVAPATLRRPAAFGVALGGARVAHGILIFIACTRDVIEKDIAFKNVSVILIIKELHFQYSIFKDSTTRVVKLLNLSTFSNPRF